MIDIDQRARFQRDGFLVVRNLLPLQTLRDALDGIDALLTARFPELSSAGVPRDPGDRERELHTKLRFAKAHDRAGLGVVYDAIRKLAPFWALIGSPELSRVASTLLETRALGVAFKSSGIRLDLPDEDRWRCDWHQEYPAQMISQRGVVAWFPLVSIDAAMGPVRIAEGSHREGLIALECEDPLNQRRDYTKAMRIPDVETIVNRYQEAAPETEPGDVVFLDFMTLHASGFNRSPRTRIACQARYVDLAEPSAVKNGWMGGMHEGGNFAAIHPDKVFAPRKNQS